jgi:hypothetical protein
MSDNYESLNNLDKAYEGTAQNNTSTQTNGKGGNFTKFLKFGTAFLVAAAAIGYVGSHFLHSNSHTENQSNSQEKTATSTATQAPSTFDKLTHFLDKPTPAPQAHYDAYVDPHSPLIQNADHLKFIKEAGDFVLPNGLSGGQAGIAIAKAQLQKGDNNLFSALTAYTEGFSGHYVDDNRGKQIADGVNALYQTKNNLSTVFGTVDQDKKNVQAIASQAGQENYTEAGKTAKVTPQQAAMVNLLLEPMYQKPVIGIIAENVRSNPNAMKHVASDHISPDKMAQQIWDEMPVNQQKVFTYMNYNLGSGNLAKFKNMWSGVVNRHLATDPTIKEGLTHFIADHMNVTYRVNVGGQIQVVENTRENAILKTAFQSKEAFGYLVGNNPAPSNFAQIAPEIVSYNNDLPKDGSTVKIEDKLADVLTQAAEQGKTVKIEQNLDQSSYRVSSDPLDLPSGLADKIKTLRDKQNTNKPAPARKSFAGMF